MILKETRIEPFFRNDQNSYQLFDLNMKPSALTFNNVSAIKRELESLLWHMAAAV